MDSGLPSSNKPGASKEDSTFDERLQRKIRGSDGASSFSTDPSGSSTGIHEEEEGNASDAKSAKDQRFDEGRLAEDATPTAADIEANHGSRSCENVDNASMSPGESNNASTAGLPSSSFVSSGHQQAHAPRQSQASFIRQRSSERQDSQTQQRHDHTNSASHLLSAVIRRNTSVSTDPNRFQASEVIYDSQRPVTAVLVDEEDVPTPTGEIVEAQAVGFFEKKWKLIVFVVVALAGALLAVGLTIGGKQPPPITMSPTSTPTLKPTFDPRPTIEQIQERGFVKCGWNRLVSREKGYRDLLCEQVASVLFGDPTKMEHVPVTMDNRFSLLQERATDLLVEVVSYTVQSEVTERVIFSKIFFYARAVYIGNQTYVECAEAGKRYGHCSEMKICAAYPSSDYYHLQRTFPSDYIVPVPNIRGDFVRPILDTYLNGTCNTIFADALYFANALYSFDEITYRNLRSKVFFGTEIVQVDPQGIVTRGDDREFADVMSWVVNAGIYGEEQNITRTPSLCQPYSSPPTASYELDYMLAVYCVGNHQYFWQGFVRDDLNRINNGTSMILPLRFGGLWDPSAGTVQGTLAAIRSKGRLDCGVVVPKDLNMSLVDAKGAIGVSVSYCTALSAAILNGDIESMRLFPYAGEQEAVEALNNGTVDVVTGAKAQMKYDLGGPGVPGVFFTTPYLYGNETAREGVTMVTMATREDDEMFCSFVNLVVLAPTHAQVHGINRQRSDAMPLVSVFGSDIGWALRDAIGQTGNYDEILAMNGVEGTMYDLAAMSEQFNNESIEFTMDRNSVVDAYDFNTSLLLSTPGLKEYNPK